MSLTRTESVKTSDPFTNLAAVGTEQTTTAAFVDLATGTNPAVIDRRGYVTTAIRLKNTGGTNALNYQVLGSLDNVTYDIPLVASTALAIGVTVLVSITAAVPYAKVQVQWVTAGTTVNGQYVQRAA